MIFDEIWLSLSEKWEFEDFFMIFKKTPVDKMEILVYDKLNNFIDNNGGDSMADPKKAMEQKQKIVDAALTVFAKKGYGRASVREIAAAAGVTTGALYYYYQNKFDLVSDVIQNHIHYVYNLSTQNEDGTFKEPEAFLKEVRQSTADRLSDDEEQKLHFLLIGEVLTKDESIKEEFRSHYREITEKTADYFDYSFDVKNDKAKKLLSSFLIAALDGMAFQNSLGLHKEDEEEMIAVFNDFFSTSIKNYLADKQE